MKSILTLLLISIAFAFGLGSANASEGLEDILQLQNNGVSQEVMLAYVQNSKVAYDPTADEITRLENGGVPATVILAMIERGKDLRGSLGASTSSPAVAAAPTPPKTEVYARPEAVETVAYAPPKEDLNISFFYEALGPHGTWHLDARYGWVWQPAVVAVETDWRPYCHGGHWVWTDCGWYWESSYPWGWAAFHYGRWVYTTDHQWVWVPDTVWGPAWVHWRSSESHYGWAPLPPEARYEVGVGFHFGGKNLSLDFFFGLAERDYTFVPCNRFLALDVVSYRAPRTQVTTIYNQTTITNNSYVYQDNRIINTGVPLQEVSARTRQKIEAVQVADSNVAAGQPISSERRSKNKILVYRPALANTTPLDPPAVAKQRLRASGSNSSSGISGAAQSQTTKPALLGERGETEKAARRRLEEEKEKRRIGEAKRPSSAPQDATSHNKQAEEKARLDAAAQRQTQEQQEQQKENVRKKAAEEQAREATEAKRQATIRQQEEAARNKLNAEKARREATAQRQAQEQQEQQKENARKKAAEEQAREATEAKRQQEEAARNKLNEEKARREAEAQQQAAKQQREAASRPKQAEAAPPNTQQAPDVSNKNGKGESKPAPAPRQAEGSDATQKGSDRTEVEAEPVPQKGHGRKK